MDRLHAGLLIRADRDAPDSAIDVSVQVRAFGGGENKGRYPVGRGKPGAKDALLGDRHRVLMAMHTAGGNPSDYGKIIPIVREFPAVRCKPRKPKEWPRDFSADRGYDKEDTR